MNRFDVRGDDVNAVPPMTRAGAVTRTATTLRAKTRDALVAGSLGSP